MSVARGYPNGGNLYSNIVKPIKIDCNFIVDAANVNGLGVRSVKSNGYVRNVFMHTSATPGSNEGYLNPNPSSGYALIQLKSNFNAYLGNLSGLIGPTSGSNINVNGSSVLTIGAPYVITAVGTVPAPKFTVLAVADSGGNSAGKYMTLTDAQSRSFVLYNVVAGVGLPPSLTGPLAGYTAIPVPYASGAANTAVATALAAVITGLSGGTSFSTSVSTATVTVTSAAAYSIPLPILPLAQTSGFTVSAITYKTLAADWQSVGLPAGLTPAVGQSFIATATGSALGSGTVKAPGISGIVSVEVVGDPNTSIANASIAANGGAWIMVQFLAATSASVTTQIASAPAVGSTVALSFFLDGSSVTVDGL